MIACNYILTYHSRSPPFVQVNHPICLLHNYIDSQYEGLIENYYYFLRMF